MKHPSFNLVVLDGSPLCYTEAEQQDSYLNESLDPDQLNKDAELFSFLKALLPSVWLDTYHTD